MISGLIHRTWSLNSKFQTFANDMENLKQKLLSNGYKRNYVERIFKKIVDKLYSVQTNKNDEKLEIEDT